MAETSLEQIEQLISKLSPEEQRLLVAHLNQHLQKTPPNNTLRPFGLCQGAFTVPKDFDAPLPEEIIKSFETS